MAETRAVEESRINTFLFFLTAVFGLFHFWILFVLTEGFTQSKIYNFLLSFILLAGLICIPVGFKISRQIPKSRYYFLTWIGYIWMGTFFIAFWVSTLFFIFNLISSYYVRGPVQLVMMGLLTLWSLYKGTRDPVVRTEKVQAEGIQNLKVIHITDLHVGQLRHDKAWLERIVHKINGLAPDLVVLTGDLVEGSWEAVFHAIQPLRDVKAVLGKVFVSGNHEFIHGGMIWEKALSDMEWTILHNENVVITHTGKKILIAGVPDRMVKRFDSSRHSLPEVALKIAEEVHFKILLAHEPASVWDLKVEKPDIILSGHTHGGQIFPFGGLVRLVQPLVVGWKTIEGVRVFAHPGTGLWGPPMRLGTESQIVLLELGEHVES